ncbi:MAG: hypothetical protein ACMXYF_01275 [Candidatus Woesearchaeota archaeon]
MQRKVIKQGNGSYTVTLPKKWTNLFEIDQTKTVTMSVKGDTLLIHTGSTKAQRYELDLQLIKNSKTIRMILVELYRKGMDVIIIKNYTQDNLFSIKKELQSLQGFQITSQSEKIIQIEFIFGPSMSDEYQKYIQRMFYILIEFCSDNSNIQLQDTFATLNNFLRRLLYKRDVVNREYYTIILNSLSRVMHQIKTIDYTKNELSRISFYLKTTLGLFQKFHITTFNKTVEQLQKDIVDKKNMEVQGSFRDIYNTLSRILVLNYLAD